MSAENFVPRIAALTGISANQVKSTLKLLEEGATIPFISRYRKEMTGNLDEVQIAEIRDTAKQLQDLEKRREAILKSIEEQGKLTPELKKKLTDATDLTTLEDLYLPYKQKRKTRAMIAREKGLEPLSNLIAKQNRFDVEAEAEKYINPDKGVNSIDEALQGARDIIAENISEDPSNRNIIRQLFARKAVLGSKVARGKKETAEKFRDYFDWSEPLSKAPSHRILAMFRGENEGLLSLNIGPDDEEAVEQLERRVVQGNTSAAMQVGMAVADSYKRLLGPSVETEFRAQAKEKADKEAVRVFADNVRQLLFESPLGRKNVLAIDPGFRTGCKVVCLNPQGDLLHNETVYPHSGHREALDAENKLQHKVEAYKIEAIAIGNGTAGRETEQFVKKLRLPKDVTVVMVNESGASVYSASPVAREEFPDYDITVRGAVSIGRRLMDPLAELVKIDPKSIGVGQYQHDVNQPLLQQTLSDVVTGAVNAVGVEVNSASKQLLTYVSGLGPALAENIIKFRKENGPFNSRKQLLKVPRMGEKAFEQCAGFLRIAESKHPLDRSSVHPERYALVEKMATDLGSSVSDLLSNPQLRKQVDLKRYVSNEVGMPTLTDIMAELEKPGRDPRAAFKQFSFENGVTEIKHLREGMVLPGIVTNITSFGCFVDIGVHQDGLVHISELANRFVKDPNEVVKLRQQVSVKVMEVDESRKRIQLSMKQA
ncbi:MAG: Tex family protein [Bacteroidota bacterium]